MLRGQFDILDISWNMYHEYLGWVTKDGLPASAFPGVNLHIWKQAKPWLYHNDAWSGALWAGLAQAYHPDLARDSGTHTREHLKGRLRRDSAAPFAWWLRKRGNLEPAAFWSERARELPGLSWRGAYARAIEKCRVLWLDRIRRMPAATRLICFDRK